MGFTTEAIEVAPTQKGYTGPNEFDLPVKEFTGYDLTTAKSAQKPAENPKQENTGVQAEGTPAQQEEPSVTLSSKMSAIARAEMADRKRKQSLDQREKDLAEKLAKAEKFDQLQAKLTAKDYSAADELGMNYDEYTKYLLDKQAGENPEEQRYRKLEDRLSASEKALEEKELREYETNQKLWGQAITTEFGDGSKYPNISYLKSKGIMNVEESVLDHINKSFEEDGIELTEIQALEEFEKEAIRRAELLSDAPVLKSRFQEQPRTLGPPKTSPKTITQNMTVTSQKQASKPFHLMSESEQIEEAMRRVNAERIARYGR